MQPETLRIGQVAQQAGVNIQTLRYYERSRLLAAPPRSRAGYRLYPRETVRIVRFVRRAQALGFTLREIRALLRLRVGKPASRDAARAAAQAKLSGIESKIRDLSSIRDALRALVDACSCESGATYCPILEALEEKNGEGT